MAKRGSALGEGKEAGGREREREGEAQVDAEVKRRDGSRASHCLLPRNWLRLDEKLDSWGRVWRIRVEIGGITQQSRWSYREKRNLRCTLIHGPVCGSSKGRAQSGRAERRTRLRSREAASAETLDLFFSSTQRNTKSSI
jgi:hypothetical protein